MDHSALIAALPVEQRLALAYATRQSHPLFLGLFALDARLGGVVRQASEPLLGQIRLAWWRDRLVAPPGPEHAGEPLLALLEMWGELRSSLTALVDAWELLLEPEALEAESLARFVDLRAKACVALARLLDIQTTDDRVRRAASGWAVADLAGKLSDPAEIVLARALAEKADWSPLRLPRSLRPFAVLYGLARRSKGQEGLLTGPTSGLVAVRLGLLGV